MSLTRVYIEAHGLEVEVEEEPSCGPVEYSCEACGYRIQQYEDYFEYFCDNYGKTTSLNLCVLLGRVCGRCAKKTFSARLEIHKETIKKE